MPRFATHDPTRAITINNNILMHTPARDDPAAAAAGFGHAGAVLCVAAHPRALPVFASAGGAGDCCVRIWVDADAVTEEELRGNLVGRG